jgi:hypothetical protein
VAGISEENTHCYGLHTASSNLWKHLLIKHHTSYLDAAKKYKWKLTKSLDVQEKPTVGSSAECQLPEYSYDVFVQYLVCFIITDDQVNAAPPDLHLSLSIPTQSLHVVNCPKFCDICWLLQPNLENVPHCNSICEQVTVEWAKAFTELCAELAVGQVTLEQV